MAKHRRPNKHKPWIETEYQGIVMENDKTVLLNPPLFAIDKDAPLHYAGEICGFKIHGQGVAFEAVVLDKVTGEGVVQAKAPLDCEEQREHTFTIQAHDCGDDAQKTNVKRSHKAIVHVHVNDVNEFEPLFVEPVYEVTLIEGKIPDLIVRVEAVDRDCSPQYSQICFYQILTPNVPFYIDNDGNVRSTEPLSVTHDGPYIFHVTAFDCGKKQAAKDAEIRVEIRPNCIPGWIGWSDRVVYPPSSGPRPLFPQIRLETCGESVWSVEAAVRLQTGHVAKGCDRDNYSERAQRRLCGASEGDVDLLPAPGPLSQWTSELPSIASRDSSRVYVFNGTRAATVPPSALPSAPLADSFTLSFWMKRGDKMPNALERDEAVICHTLQAENGYAHYALTLHGPRVTFLYWPQLGASRPVKFRWKLEQAWDGEWHHYALSLQFPTVIFYVDGVTYEPALILDSGPFHPPRPSPRLLIAACWNDGQWKETNNITDITFGTLDSAPDRFLGALLAGVTLRAGSIDSREVLGCLYSCKEGLDFSDFESLGKGMKVHINPSQTLLVLEGDDVENINRAIEHVIYRNALRFATPGARPFQLTTTVKCFSEEACVEVPAVRGVVEVLQPDGPRISLSGERHLARPALDYEGASGVPLFPSLRVTCSITHHLRPHQTPAPTPAPATADQETLSSDSFIHNLESCEILVLGDGLDPGKESLLLDLDLLQQKGLHLTNASNILTISGVENIGAYEIVLRDVRYRVEPGAALYERKFRLQCAEMSGRYVSNEFTVEVNVLHSLGSPARPSHLQSGHQFVHSGRRPHHEMGGHRLAEAHRSVVPGAATVIVLVCVAFLVLMVTLGIFRIRSVHRGLDTRKGPELEKEAFWEDSALTIIVNPMETYEQRQGSCEVAGGHEPVNPDLEAAADRRY